MEKNIPHPERFTPAGKRILVLPDETSNKTAGGIMLPDKAIERPQTGKVIRIGPEVTLYQTGNTVLYGKSAGIKIDFMINDDPENPEYKEHWLMQESELFGTL